MGARSVDLSPNKLTRQLVKPCGLLLLLLVLAGHSGAAQTSPDASAWPARRWTVGLQAIYYPRMAMVDAANGQSGYDYGRPWPVLPTAAYQTRRWGTVEIGLLFRAVPPHTTTATDPDGQGNSTIQRQSSMRAVPVLYRGPLQIPSPGRWRADLVVGFMPVSSYYRETITRTNFTTGQTYSAGNYQSEYADFLLLGGLGGAYALTPHFSLTADARMSFSVASYVAGKFLSDGQNDIATFAPAISAGVRYQFGQELR